MENEIDKRHFQDMERLSQRLDTAKSKSSKADMWNTIKKGFEKVKNSSAAGAIAALVGVGATMVYGANVNDGIINVDLTTPLMTSVFVGYASMAAFIGSHLGSKHVDKKLSNISNDLSKNTSSLRSDTSSLMRDINESSKTNGVTEEKADKMNALYDQVFSKSLNTPLEKEQEKYADKKKNSGFKFT